MRERGELLSRRQMTALTFTALISPIFRQLPSAPVRAAGSAAWLTGAAALPLVLPLFFLVRALLRACRPGEGLEGALCRALGEIAGRAVLALYALWMAAYLGFVLRAGADRFVNAVYPHSRPGVFVLVMAALTGLAGLGRAKVLGRCAQVIRPILLLLFGVVFAFVLPQIDVGNLLPLSRLDIVPVARGALPVADTLAVAVYAAFLEGWAESEGRLRRSWVAILLQVLLVTLLCAATLGTFGAELTAKLNHPFFVMLRDVKVAHLLERTEALLIAQWVFTDFVLSSLLLHGAAACSLRVLGRRDERTRRGCAAGLLLAATAAAFLAAPTAFRLQYLSDVVMPLANAIMLFGVVPLSFVVGKIRHTI